MDTGKITYEIIKTGQDLDTILVRSGGREVPLHSRVNPERDSDLLKDKFDPSRYDFLVILGVGLGYHCLPLKNLIDRYRRVILVDILDGIEAAIAANRITSFLLKDTRITLVAGKTAAEAERIVAENLDMDDVRGISVLEHPASMRIFGDYYDSIKKSIDKIIAIKAGNKATRQAFGIRYLRNVLLNFTMIKKARPVRSLFNAFAGYPVIIAGSGPSLDDGSAMIGRYQDRFFIIAVDSTLPVLEQKGIRPDIVITIDPQPYAREHFLGCGTDGVLAVYSISSHPSLVRGLRGFVSFNSHTFSQLASEVYGGQVGSIDSGTGNVSGDAVSLAVKCGFSSIGITGLDFSFSRFAVYARGTAYQKRYGAFFQDRFSTVEGLNMRYIMTSSGGTKHGGIFTRKSFLHYHHALEDYIRDNALSSIIALNGRGIPLAGAVPMDMESYIRLHCPKIIDKKRVLEAIDSSAREIDAAHLADALGRIVNNVLFDELLEASLGGRVDDTVKNRYRTMARIASSPG